MKMLNREQTETAVTQLIPFYESLQPEDVEQFKKYYRHDACFKDPFNQVSSIEGIQHIFKHMFTQVNDPAFRISKTIVGDGEAILFWTFHFRFKGLGCKDNQTLQGVSHLEFDETGLVTLHRDYWDAAEELYSRLPVIGTLMRGLQRMIRA
jgi:steroid Delta-isomerase